MPDFKSHHYNNFKMKRILPSLSLLLLIFQSSLATTYYWIGGSSLKWSNPLNWSLSSGGSPANSAPVQNDIVIFDKGGNVTVEFDVADLDIGFADFKVINNTQLTLINTINVSKKSFCISKTSGTYYEVVQAGSSLTLKSNSNTDFSFGSDVKSAGIMVFNGKISCIIQDGVNTDKGPMINATSNSFLKDSIIINDTFYIGPYSALQTGGINPVGNNFRFGPNSVYHIDKDGGVYLYGKWESGSLIKITGTRSRFPTYWNGIVSPGYKLGGFEIDAPFANVSPITNLGIPTSYGITFQNDFKIKNLGTSAGVLLSKIGNIKILGNLIINSGKVQAGADAAQQSNLEVEGNLIVDSGAVLDLQGSSSPTYLKLKGNATINGTITESGSSNSCALEMVGTAAQSITAKGSIEENVSLAINNPAGVNCLTDLKLGGGFAAMLKLKNGNLKVSANDKTVFVRNDLYDAIEGGSDSSHIIGKLYRASAYQNSYSFPVSDNDTDLATAIIDVSSNAATSWTVAFKRPNANGTTGLPNGIPFTSNYIWDINREGQGQSANAEKIELKYATIANNEITDSAQTYILRWDNNQWTSLGGQPNTTGGILSVNNPVTNFGVFCFGKLTGTVNPPQLFSNTSMLEDFGETCIGASTAPKSLILTGSYLNADKIIVGPAAGFKFSTGPTGPFLDSISITQAGGKLDSTFIYVIFNPSSAASFSASIPVSGGGSNAIYITAAGTGIDNISCRKPFLYPNPNAGSFYVNLPLFENNADRTVVIYDSKGARVYSRTFNQALMSIQCPILINGAYYLKVFDKFGNKLKAGSFVIIK